MPSARVLLLAKARIASKPVAIACAICYGFSSFCGGAALRKDRRMAGSLQHAIERKRSRWISKPISASKMKEFPVVAVGASAGGLDACRKLLDALPAGNGMAFIIVQHLAPSHESMMVDLLAGHTAMPVLLATEGMPIERERVYVIPPGVYPSVDDKGALRISKPQARHGARLPFDFLLNSLARVYGARAICVVLPGPAPTAASA